MTDFKCQLAIKIKNHTGKEQVQCVNVQTIDIFNQYWTHQYDKNNITTNLPDQYIQFQTKQQLNSNISISTIGLIPSFKGTDHCDGVIRVRYEDGHVYNMTFSGYITRLVPSNNYKYRVLLPNKVK